MASSGRVAWRFGLSATVVALAALAGQRADAQPAETGSMLARYGQRYFQLNVASGRIAVTSLRRGGFSTSSSGSDGRKEQLSVQSVGGSDKSELTYELSTPGQTLSIRLTSEGQIRLRLAPKGDTAGPAIEFLQEAGKPLVLSVGPDRWESPTIWHLLLAHPEECQKHVLPRLELFHPGWDLAATAQQVEAELLRAAKSDQPPDRQRWAELVTQLGSEEYGRREAADRELRRAGRRVVIYLQSLDPKTLDAEQRFRIRRIVRSLSDTVGDESVREIASVLIDDPAVWLILLGRPDATVRKTAAVQISRLLGGPIEYDPDAPVETRRGQIEALRRRLAPPSS